MSDLTNLRSRIDTLDNQLVKLLNERAQVSINIGLVKKTSNPSTEGPSHVHVPAREIAVYDKIRTLNHGPLSNEAVEAIYREIMSASISLQRDITIAFLGPRGSYSQTAALLRFGDSVAYADQPTIRDVFKAVESGAATYGIVPFENSTLGSVGQTLDSFIASNALTSPETSNSVTHIPSSAPAITLRTNVMIRAEIYLPIHHCLLSKSTSLSQIKKVYSHPEALGQVAKWLSEHMRGVERIAVASTSYAAELASQESDAAAVCNIVCADMYGLNALAKDIEDLKNNTTRFFVIGDKTEGPTGNDRTLMYFTVDHRMPGALCDVLNAFKDQDINLTKIDSRPSGMMPWHYFFFVEFEGHMEDAKVNTAIKTMSPFLLSLKVLGSYPNQRPSP
ncbi:Prephenate dehydratase-domain-containing protein [Chytridium lagenaria]|nr:Prephenate dehydratase-domain-containing protein [Chytridium lagenaria]